MNFTLSSSGGSLWELEKGRLVVCLDEFPYLVQSDPTLPSVLQKWWDHKKKTDVLLLLCGSSRRMMADVCLRLSAPLYGRSQKILCLQPMGYRDFCRALSLKVSARDSFLLFSMVGGIPKYWELIHLKMTPLQAAGELFSGFAPYMENEPRRLLSELV